MHACFDNPVISNITYINYIITYVCIQINSPVPMLTKTNLIFDALEDHQVPLYAHMYYIHVRTHVHIHTYMYILHTYTYVCTYILQVVLQVMLNSSSAGSFAGELDKWHKYFQTIEEVLEVWLEVQDLWFELEEVGVVYVHIN